jgi:hypothetical protein
MSGVTIYNGETHISNEGASFPAGVATVLADDGAKQVFLPGNVCALLAQVIAAAGGVATVMFRTPQGPMWAEMHHGEGAALVLDLTEYQGEPEQVSLDFVFAGHQVPAPNHQQPPSE